MGHLKVFFQGRGYKRLVVISVSGMTVLTLFLSLTLFSTVCAPQKITPTLGIEKPIKDIFMDLIMLMGLQDFGGKAGLP